MNSRDLTERQTGYIFILIFVILAMGILTAGYLYFRYYERHFRNQVESGLSAISKLKVSELVQYRKERMSDANIFYRNTSFTELVKRFFKNPEDKDTHLKLQEWIGKYIAHYQYNCVFLVDTGGVIRMKAPETQTPIAVTLSQRISEVLQSPRVSFVDFYRNEHDQRIYLDVLVPILDEKNKRRVIGILVLRIDPATYLYPYINRWPVPSRTAETLIIRREGNDVLFLNELRFRKNTALNLRFSLDCNKELPAVKAALGQKGIIEGLDYRGMPVIACVTPVPDSPWFLVARMNKSEAFGPVREFLLVIVALIVSLLISAGACIGYIWRRQNLRFYREQYKMIDALQASEIRFRQVAENINEVFWLQDRETGQILYVSPAYEKIWGQPCEELYRTSRSFMESVHPDDRERVEASYQALNNEGDRFDEEYRIVRFDGSIRWLRARTYPVFDPVGRIVRFAGIAEDITERKRAAAALQESEKRYRDIFEMIPVSIWEYDFSETLRIFENIRNGEPVDLDDYFDRNPAVLDTLVSSIKLIDVNTETVLMYGAQTKDDIFRGFGKHRLPETWNTFRLFTAAFLSGEELPKIETVNETIDGRHLDVILKVSLTEESRTTGRVLFTVIDITERKRLEDERRKLEQQIQQTQKLESLGVLAGGIAHDFNNILMAVLGHAELALDEISPMSAAHDDIIQITTAARRAAELCRQMLAYSGKASFTLEQVDMGVLIEEMIHLLKTSISKKAILNLNLERGLPPIMADPSQIRQVVMNLIINASEAIGDRSGVITISMGATRCDKDYLRRTELNDDLEPGLYVHLEVADNGGGMDAGTRARIFEPFFTTKFTGRGLGLAAVMGIIHAHKGALKVYSEPDKGTTFKILFPAQETVREKAYAEESSILSDLQEKGTILLADDDESVRTLCVKMLERFGFTVITATDGSNAVDIYRERGNEIDLIILDLTMPNMDGAETFGEIRRLNPKALVILSSGYSKEDVTARFAGKGLTGVLHKPFTLDKLKELLSGLKLKREN